MILISPAGFSFGGEFAHYMPLSAPISIGTLAAWMMKHDIDTRVFDDEVKHLEAEDLHDLVQGMDKPYVFGITCMTAHVRRANEIMRLIRQELPGSYIILGGIHPTAEPEEALLLGLPDFVVRGEGEQALLQLYQSIKNNEDYSKIKSLSFIRDGKIIHNPEGAMLSDLDDIPMFPYHLFDNPRYDWGFMITSRGCPYKCTYCSQRMMTGTTYRYKSVDRMIEELDILINRYGQHHINFYDDNFCIKKSRVIEICEKIVEKGWHKTCQFMLQTRADNYPEELVPIMANAGMTKVSFGMETAVDRISELIQKEETVQTHIDAVALARKYGVSVYLLMIYGFPTETSEDRETSYRTMLELGVSAPKFNNLIPYPGTPMYTSLKGSPRVHIEPDWQNFNSTLAATSSIFSKIPLPYVPETASEFELKRDMVRNNIRGNLSLKGILNILKNKEEAAWVTLPNQWYLKPKEIIELVRIGIILVTNISIASLPLWISEPFMNALNPNMKKRPRIKNYDPQEYVAVGWSAESSKLKAELMAKARQQVKQNSLEKVSV